MSILAIRYQSYFFSDLPARLVVEIEERKKCLEAHLIEVIVIGDGTVGVDRIHDAQENRITIQKDEAAQQLQLHRNLHTNHRNTLQSINDREGTNRNLTNKSESTPLHRLKAKNDNAEEQTIRRNDLLRLNLESESTLRLLQKTGIDRRNSIRETIALFRQRRIANTNNEIESILHHRLLHDLLEVIIIIVDSQANQAVSGKNLISITRDKQRDLDLDRMNDARIHNRNEENQLRENALALEPSL